jgi:hypothetical protein
MYTTDFEGIRFVEGRPTNARILAPIDIRLGGIFASSQLKNLNDVKKIMADQARQAGANAVIDFKYGQKSAGFWGSLLQRDDVSWYGTGFLAVLT